MTEKKKKKRQAMEKEEGKVTCLRKAEIQFSDQDGKSTQEGRREKGAK